MRKITLISKFKISQPDKQTITIQIFPKISRGKGSRAIKFGQVIEYTREILFFKNYAENEVKRLVPDLFLLFEKTLYDVKASGIGLNFNTL